MVAGKTFGYEVAATLDAGEVRACGIDARRPCQPRLRLHNPVHLAGWIIGRRSTDGDSRAMLCCLNVHGFKGCKDS